MQNFKSNIEHMVFMMYVDKFDTEHVEYNLVDEFYSYLGYSLESQNLLLDLGVQGTSDLFELLAKVQND